MLSLVVLLGSAGLAAAADCARATLESGTAAFLTAVAGGKTSFPELASSVVVIENNETVDIGKSYFATPVTVDLNRTFVDVEKCGTFTELNAASNKHPYVIITRLFFDGASADAKINRIESVVTDDGDWAFNAAGHLRADKAEKWDAIPTAKQDSRAVLQAAGDAYLDSWGDGTVSPPFGNPCSRIEGGSSTGSSGNTCKMPQFPSGFKIRSRSYMVDPQFGAVDIFNNFPFIDKAKPDGTSSTNIFRVEAGKIRYIHELTVCTHKGCSK